MFACNGILFNHESPVRGETFVTRKIARALVRIKLGMQKNLYLGNLEAKRDWGHAKDYVEAQWLMLQQKKPDDFVIATGKQHSVRDFINLSSEYLDMKINWKGKNLNEVGSFKGKDIIKIDSRYFRPTEVETLLGDASKAKEKLNWSPKISFKQLVKEMIDEDLKLAKNEKQINQ
jgi:GDPmannose 4,6-dehydratase